MRPVTPSARPTFSRGSLCPRTVRVFAAFSGDARGGLAAHMHASFHVYLLGAKHRAGRRSRQGGGGGATRSHERSPVRHEGGQESDMCHTQRCSVPPSVLPCRPVRDDGPKFLHFRPFCQGTSLAPGPHERLVPVRPFPRPGSLKNAAKGSRSVALPVSASCLSAHARGIGGVCPHVGELARRVRRRCANPGYDGRADACT